MWCSACEIRGRLRCSAASVGYRGRIWKAFVHSPVTLLSRNLCQARNYRRRGIPRTKGGGETVRVRVPLFRPVNLVPWVRQMRVSRVCGRFWLAPRSLGRGDRNRRESRLIRPPRDTSDRACDRVRPVFSKKQENTGDNGLKRARETCSLAVGCRWTSSGSGGMNARPAYLRHER